MPAIVQSIEERTIDTLFIAMQMGMVPAVWI
jgi:hypothetical protein